MRSAQSILNQSFHYVPATATATSVADTWRRFGWQPTTEEERKGRLQPTAILGVQSVAEVDPAADGGSASRSVAAN
jgi:hypothetical protein